MASFSSGSRPVSATRADKINALIGNLIAENMLPISVVDSPAFVNLVTFQEPSYKVPCRQTMTDLLRRQEKELKAKVKAELVQDKSMKVAITTDIWTSLTNQAYMSVTASYIMPEWKLKTPVLSTFPMDECHTADYITQSLKQTADEWSIADQISVVVHDGAANVKEVGEANDWADVSCAAHKIHLVVSSSLGIDKVSNTAISKCVGAASRLVTHFHHSCLATTELLKRQKTMYADKTPRKLIQCVKTRWNSVYDMFDRLLELRWPVVAVLSDRNVTKQSEAKTLDMKEEYWVLMEDLLPVLRPLQIVTSLFSAEQSPSASTVFPTLWELCNREMAPCDTDSSAATEFKVCFSLILLTTRKTDSTDLRQRAQYVNAQLLLEI